MVAIYTINENHSMSQQTQQQYRARQAQAIALFRAYAAQRVAQSAQ
jgi:hypothetical protein